MENEYANFGLPNDPANQPNQQDRPVAPRPRGWLSRNVWWLLPTGFLALVLPCGCCGGLFVWLIGSLKSSEPYQMALHRVQTVPQVIAVLGKPVEESGLMPTGNFSYHTNNGVASGNATFDFSVSGPKGMAHVHAEAVCRNGKWGFRVLQVTPASTGRVTLLLDCRPAHLPSSSPSEGEEANAANK